jgi:hypothetical protein
MRYLPFLSLSNFLDLYFNIFLQIGEISSINSSYIFFPFFFESLLTPKLFYDKLYDITLQIISVCLSFSSVFSDWIISLDISLCPLILL